MRKLIKKNKGITLIALVITIIVLLILASVTMRLVLGENGLINRVKQAKNDSEKTSAIERMNLKITECQIQSYSEREELPNLAYLAAFLQYDKDTIGDIAYVEMESQKQAALDTSPYTSWEKLYTKLAAYPYEFVINKSLQLESVDGIQVASLPASDSDSIISMTKAELDSYVETLVANKVDEIIEEKLAEYTKTEDLASTYATKTEMNALNTHWTELASTNSRDLKSKDVNLDSYNQIALTAWNGGHMYECLILPVSEFKAKFTSSSAELCFWDVNHFYQSNTFKDKSYYVTAYYSGGKLYYQLGTGDDTSTAMYVKVFGIK